MLEQNDMIALPLPPGPLTLPMDAPIWSETVELVVIDNNLWKRSQGGIINEWLDQFDQRLVVKFLTEDGEPEVEFIPHGASQAQSGLMCDRNVNSGFWARMVAGASRNNRLTFQIVYRYKPV